MVRPAHRATLRLNRHYRALAGEPPGTTLLSIDARRSPGGGLCPLILNGRVLRWDSLHFTSAYSREIVPTIVARAERAGVRFRARQPSPSSRAGVPPRRVRPWRRG